MKSFNSSFSWWYAWDQMPYTTSPLSYGAANGKEFVPMQGSLQSLDQLDSKIAQLNTYQTTKHLLGWNAPDQASMSPTVGAQSWYKLEAVAQKYGLQLGGPAVASSASWLDSWFRACDDLYCNDVLSDASGKYGGDGATCKGAATLGSTVCKTCAGKPYGQRGCRVDFLSLILYFCSLDKFKAALDVRGTAYGLPLWVIQHGCMPTWEWPAYNYDTAQQYTPMVTIMQQQLDFLDSHPNVSRYAWWTHQSQNNGAYIYHQLYSDAATFAMSPVGITYNTYHLNGPTAPDGSSLPTPSVAPAPSTAPVPAPAPPPAPSAAWNTSLKNCSFTSADVMGLGAPLSAAACVNPTVDMLPGLRTSYNGPFQPSCAMAWWPSSTICATLTRVAKVVFLGDSVTKQLHDELFAVVRDNVERGYMSPATPAAVVSTCRCQTPYLAESTQNCKNYAQSFQGRLQTEHWSGPTGYRFWFSSDLCEKAGLVEFEGTFTNWTTSTESKTTMADLETIIQRAGGNIYLVTGGTPPYSQKGTGSYNGTYNCLNVLQPIAALYRKYNISFSRLLVMGVHKEEQKTWYGLSDGKIQGFNSVWKQCAQTYAPGSAFMDSYALSTAGGFQAATQDGLHAGLKLNMLKLQTAVQQMAASLGASV